MKRNNIFKIVFILVVVLINVILIFLLVTNLTSNVWEIERKERFRHHIDEPEEDFMPEDSEFDDYAPEEEYMPEEHVPEDSEFDDFKHNSKEKY